MKDLTKIRKCTAPQAPSPHTTTFRCTYIPKSSVSVSRLDATGDKEEGAQRDHGLVRPKMYRKMALSKRDEVGEKRIRRVEVMVGGKEKLYVTCSSRSFFSKSTTQRYFSALFPCFLYKMTSDDESDPFRGEVSLRRNSREETFISTIHAFPDNPLRKLSAQSEGC